MKIKFEYLTAMKRILTKMIGIFPVMCDTTLYRDIKDAFIELGTSLLAILVVCVGVPLAIITYPLWFWVHMIIYRRRMKIIWSVLESRAKSENWYEVAHHTNSTYLENQFKYTKTRTCEYINRMCKIYPEAEQYRPHFMLLIEKEWERVSENLKLVENQKLA